MKKKEWMQVMANVSAHKIWNFDLGNVIREEELDGRKYAVVPMIMILEGVHTGSQGAVYYSIDELAKTPKMWNFKPIVIEHPFRGDTATDLEVYKKQSVGMVMNTHFIDGKLKAEAWIDIEKAQQKCPELLEHINHRLPMEVSTGLFSELVLDEGVWQGEPYKGRIINIRADHLAILPRKQGACSLSDGAGLLINQRNDMLDALNVITTIVNQEYVAGSLVTGDVNEDERKDKSNEKMREKPQEEPKEQKVKKPVEDKFQRQVFQTADGYTITVDPPANATFKAPEVKFDDVKDDTPKDNTPETVPLQDHAVIVDDDDIEFGEEEFISLLHNICRETENWQNVKNAVLPEDKGKMGGRRFKELDDGTLVLCAGEVGRTWSDAGRERNAERRQLRGSLVELQIPLVRLKEELNKQFPEYELEDLDTVLSYDPSGGKLTDQQLTKLRSLLSEIEALEKAVREKTEDYWQAFEKTGPVKADKGTSSEEIYKGVLTAARLAGQLETAVRKRQLDSIYANKKAGKKANPKATFQLPENVNDAGIEKMKKDIEKVVAEESEAGASAVANIISNVQRLLVNMSRVSEDKRRLYTMGIIAAMDQLPALYSIPELAKLARNFKKS